MDVDYYSVEYIVTTAGGYNVSTIQIVPAPNAEQKIVTTSFPAYNKYQ